MRALACLLLAGCCWTDELAELEHLPPPSDLVTVDGITGPVSGDGCATFVGNLCEHDLVAKGWTDETGWHSVEYRCPPGRGMEDKPGCIEEQYETSTGLSTWCGPE